MNIGVAQAQTNAFVPGLDVSYYSIEDLSGTPAATSIVNSVDATWNGSPAPGVPTDHWSASFIGYVTAPSTGDFEFGTYADDGARLWINGQLIIDDWNVHGATYRGSGPVHLVQGQRVPLVFKYFEYDLVARAQLLWGPVGNTSPIPASAFSREPHGLWARFLPRPNMPERMVNGIFQGSNGNGLWSNLATVSSVPSNDIYTQLPLGTKRYRYLRYLSPNGSYSNVSEIDFYFDTQNLNDLETTAPFGTPGSNLAQGMTFIKALDGDTNTFFDGPNPDGGYVGIDTGSTGPITGKWLVGSPIGSNGISYPADNSLLASNSTSSLIAHNAVDWDDFVRTVQREVTELSTTDPTTTTTTTKTFTNKIRVADVCFYTWSADIGTFPEGNTGTTVTYKAPAVTTATTATIVLTLTDQGGANQGLYETGARTNSDYGAGDLPLQFILHIQIKP